MIRGSDVTSEGLFNVYIERASASAPDASAKLARAIASHYGIDATAIEQRLGVGRFRVKGNVDRATADSFAADLSRLGAIVKVERAEEATPPPRAPAASAPAATAPAATLPPRAPAATAPAATAAGKPAQRNRTPPTGVKIPSLKPAAPVSLQQPRITPPEKPSKPQYASGLAAAAAAQSAADVGLGALGGDIPLTLSTLDGEDDAGPSASGSIGLPASFGPPPDPPARAGAKAAASAASSDDFDVAIDDDAADDAGRDGEDMAAALPASIGPAALPASMGPAMAPRDLGGAQDMFAPPEANEDIPLALEVEVRKKPAAAAPPVMAPEPAAGPAVTAAAAVPGAAHDPLLASPVVRAPGEPAWKRLGRDERARFVAGVVVAAAIGCVPALVTASVRKRSAFAEIDSQLEGKQAAVLTRGDWDNLDRVRTSFVERKKSEQQSIAITSLLLWAVVSGGAAFVWFRKIDWDRIFDG